MNKGEEEWIDLGREIEKGTVELKSHRDRYHENEGKILLAGQEIERLTREKTDIVEEISFKLDSNIHFMKLMN